MLCRGASRSRQTSPPGAEPSRTQDPVAVGVLGGADRVASATDQGIGTFAGLTDRAPDAAGLRFGGVSAQTSHAPLKKAEPPEEMANASVTSMSQWASTSIWNAIMAEKASVTAVAADPWRTFSNASG